MFLSIFALLPSLSFIFPFISLLADNLPSDASWRLSPPPRAGVVALDLVRHCCRRRWIVAVLDQGSPYGESRELRVCSIGKTKRFEVNQRGLDGHLEKPRRQESYKTVIRIWISYKASINRV
jgi:hypothetical protein